MFSWPKVDPQQIVELLKKTLDPLTQKSLIEAGRIEGINIDKNRINVSLKIPASQQDQYRNLQQNLTRQIQELTGQKNVFVVMTEHKGDREESQIMPVSSSQINLPQVKSVIAVASGKGGVGKSMIAVNLALALKNLNLNVGIVDGDIYGPSIPKMINHFTKPEVDKDKKFIPLTKFGLQWMSIGFFIAESAPLIWRGPMIQTSFMQLIREVAWPDLDILIIDLPPGTGDTHLTLVQKIPLKGVVIVSTPQDLALIDARKALNMFKKVTIPILGMIENMSYYECPACGVESSIFSQGMVQVEAQKEKVPYLGEIPLHIDLRQSADSGIPLGAQIPDHPLSHHFKQIAEKMLLNL